VCAYFVLDAPVEVSFDMVTSFIAPAGQHVRIRATGSLQVRCADPALLVAQFVGLPFDHVNDGILRSVSRSVERMLARLLTRRVVMAGTPAVVSDKAMLPHIVEELIAYNPAAGAVFGIELIRIGHLVIVTDDGTTALSVARPMTATAEWGRVGRNGETPTASAPTPPMVEVPLHPTPPPLPTHSQTMRHAAVPAPPQPYTPALGVPLVVEPSASQKHRQLVSASGEIVIKPPPEAQLASGTPPPRAAQSMEIPRAADDVTPPAMPPATKTKTTPPEQTDAHSSILGIGVSHISGEVVGEIPSKVPPGGRVLVPGPNGLMQSATVRQLLQGYYELEVGSSGETIWVPMSGVVPE
jgi:hypothetical protein